MQNTLIIAGLGRSGTSLCLQMLDAAGIRCAGDYPTFEDRAGDNLTPEFLEAHRGGAVKWLNPHRSSLPHGRVCHKIVLLTRSKRQQAMSQIKFLEVTGCIPEGKSFAPDAHARMSESLKDDQRAAFERVSASGCPVLKLRFEDLVERPDTVLPGFAEFCGVPADKIHTMRKVIRLRDGSCYPGLLELDLMREREASQPALPTFDLLNCTCNFPGNARPCAYCKSGEFAVPTFDS